jgi:hypothetical protein
LNVFIAGRSFFFIASTNAFPPAPFGGNAYPDELATYLYFMSICIARVRCRADITTLTRIEIREGAAWLLEQPWVDEESTALLRDLLPQLD